MTPRKPGSNGIESQSASSGYLLAELCFQRGEFDRALHIVNHLGFGDHKVVNLKGVCQARLTQFDDAIATLDKLRKKRLNRSQKEMVTFNLGLACLFRDLKDFGDLSVQSSVATRHLVQAVYQPLRRQPFMQAIDVWSEQLKKKCQQEVLFRTYLAFAQLQIGQLDAALLNVVKALQLSESHYESNFVVGKIFLDLYQLGLEQSDFGLLPFVVDFFGIDKNEITRSWHKRKIVLHAVLLEISIQALLEARDLSRFAPEVLIGLFHSFLMAGLMEEAYQFLLELESGCPEGVAQLEPHIAYYAKAVKWSTDMEPMFDKIKSAAARELVSPPWIIMAPSFLV